MMKLSLLPYSLIEARKIFLFPRKFQLDPDCCAYFEAYTEMVDKSFVVKNGESILAWVGIASNEKEISFYGWPVEYVEQEGLDGSFQIEIRKFILSYITELTENQFIHAPAISLFGKWASLPDSVIDTRLKAQIDLSLSDELIKKSIRDSYRSLINKGRRELETIIHFGPMVKESTFMSSKDFHTKVSGRQTRSDLTWQIQYQMLVKNKAFLVEGKINGISSTYTFVMCSEGDAYYGFGVYDRELMKQGIPLSHWPIMASILKAKELGMKTFILGDVGPHFESPKESEIAVFKRGFTDFIIPQTTYKVLLVREKKV